ncbi:hypothetical protein [Verrucomicrobium spinosum]|uniref:hypothetical protein n=1 Tax=Verrucomicrobium spinosum TaxID=2736 RepID=UPI000B001871
MRFTTLLKNPADWMQGRGPHSDIVMTSRIRLARNLRGWSFPGWSSERQRVDLMNEVRPIVAGLPEMKDGFNEEYPNLTKTKKQVLVERHLVSREHAARSTGCAILIDRRQSLAIMVNEEDHFRMQGIRAGLDLRTAYELVNRVDSELENFLPYAYDSRLATSPPAPPTSAPACAPLPCCTCRARAYGADQAGDERRQQDRSGRARPLWRGHRGPGQPFSGLQPTYAGGN